MRNFQFAIRNQERFRSKMKQVLGGQLPTTISVFYPSLERIIALP